MIDPDNPGKFLKANQAYSAAVAGIYSTKPGFVGRLQPANDPASANEVPMAMVGRVPTKVSAENGPIHVGDLLVTSSTMGYAMKGTDRSQMLGAVVGKALSSLDSGTGVIMVLVALHTAVLYSYDAVDPLAIPYEEYFYFGGPHAQMQ